MHSFLSLGYTSIIFFSDSPARYIPLAVILRPTVSLFATFVLFHYLPLTEIYYMTCWFYLSEEVYTDTLSGGVLLKSVKFCGCGAFLYRFALVTNTGTIGLACIFLVWLRINNVLSALAEWIGKRKERS